MDEKYISEVVNYVKELLKNRYEVYANQQVKTNSVVVNGICIHSKGSNISPIIPIDNYYESGMNEFETAVKVVERYNEIKDTELPFDVHKLLDFKEMQDKVAYRLVNIEANRELLESSPYCEVTDDLALVYYLELGNGMITISDTLMEIWEVTEDDLYEMAVVNTPKLHPVNLGLMVEAIADMIECTEDFQADKYDMGCEHMTDEEFKKVLIERMDDGNSIPMFVLRGGDTYGASVLMYEDVLDTIHEVFGKDFYVFLPSVHELLLLPCFEEYDISTLKSMVQIINETKLKPEDMLSDSVYFFDEKGLSEVKSNERLNDTRNGDSRLYDEAR